MNRTQRAKIRAAREHLEMSRSFKNDALESMIMHHRCMFPQTSDRRFKDEKEIFKGAQKNLRRLKKYNGPTGIMSESNYMELMGT